MKQTRNINSNTENIEVPCLILLNVNLDIPYTSYLIFDTLNIDNTVHNYMFNIIECQFRYTVYFLLDF